jgi:4-amino-4-deoxy-L-arabinose transferase-like glycosyltransferase
LSPRDLGLLLLGAIACLTAGAGRLSLPSLDDAFYARKGVEMARQGASLTVTWNGEPTAQHPPLHFWTLAAAFRLLGEHDLAARLPATVAALGVLAGTWWLGTRAFGAPAAHAALALLLLSPVFLAAGRGAMMETPLTLWVLAFMVLLLEGLARPPLHALLALPLAAAILTKSAFGLLPLLVLAAAAPWSAALRAALRRPWIWVGVAGGLALAATWFAQPGVFRDHVAGHAAVGLPQTFGPRTVGAGHLWTLVDSYQPAVLPAVAGAWLLLRRPVATVARPAIPLLLAWVLVPVGLYSLLAYRPARHIFPVLPALALLGGHWLVATLPRLTEWLVRWLLPAWLAAAAVVLWVEPTLVVRDDNHDLKAQAPALGRLLPAGESLPYAGRGYWRTASPLLYYAERHLAWPALPPADALRQAATRPHGLLVADAAASAEIRRLAPGAALLAAGDRWAVLRLPRPRRRRPGLDPGRGED